MHISSCIFQKHLSAELLISSMQTEQKLGGKPYFYDSLSYNLPHPHLSSSSRNSWAFGGSHHTTIETLSSFTPGNVHSKANWLQRQITSCPILTTDWKQLRIQVFALFHLQLSI